MNYSLCDRSLGYRAIGLSLITATPATQGRFWLADGTTTSPLIGDSWGYPDATSPDAIAQTDLLVYHLPSEEWELVRTLAPQIFTSKNAVKTAEQSLSSSLTQIPLPQMEYLFANRIDINLIGDFIKHNVAVTVAIVCISLKNLLFRLTR
jgi:hypothetical protein